LFEEQRIRPQIVAETSSAAGLVCIGLNPSIVYEVTVVQPINRPNNPLTNYFLADLRHCLVKR
jgi:hypothetical protein